ncbi:NUDIX hydrolase [Heyndrickxia ginsengihumi]|uniref:CoA pyrophosphatase n=1 Tax=Heyndrickxia ginsengihumi TaxID=363870 RepID=A0A0A6V958_9BACI|nr:CoA pyrophosphatase [Heyndrickxia ginsengihumi]KHD84108.1 NUDIX hydrolase [Heyndrickxia ginsengihumi]MBE6185249.1 CoA pyrophosphatase [Bacillus sp. (in: firmicutes)]MCM3023430.1 CoA pyrophosphatase [Heyndrickxia ginsengihumi]NEY21577.1 CoA pyrophosphatase [Heyndrickxia ginsengihumi]
MDVNKRIQQLQSYDAKMFEIEMYSQYAVLIPLIQKEQEIHILFEVRSQHLKSQPGEICFPGGRVEQTDINYKQAAIRETSEELGINQADIKDVFQLDYHMDSFRKRIVFPFAGYIEANQFQPNCGEVKEIFTVPISHFLTVTPDCYTIDFQLAPESSFPFHLINGGKNYKWGQHQKEEYFYYYQNYVIWGLTASILNNFIRLLEKS